MNDNEPTETQLSPGANGTEDNRKILMDASACRGRAIADLQQASTLPTANARRMLEASAAVWGARAALLDANEGSRGLIAQRTGTSAFPRPAS